MSSLPDQSRPTTDTAARTRPISVSVKNGCASKTLFVSLCFVDATNTWVSHGWYKVLPNQTRTGLAQAHLANVYFYAESGESRWQGTEGAAMTSMVPVHPTNTFGGTFEELEKTDGMTKVPFFGRTVEAGQLEYTQLFTCD